MFFIHTHSPQPLRRPTTAFLRSVQRKHAQWSYTMTRTQRGLTVRRETFSVAIDDPAGNRAGFLSGFASWAKAEQGAQAWIDRQQQIAESLRQWKNHRAGGRIVRREP